MDNGDLPDDENEYYTLEDIMQLDDPTMATLAANIGQTRLKTCQVQVF